VHLFTSLGLVTLTGADFDAGDANDDAVIDAGEVARLEGHW
jgi:hypothetical protein